MRRMNPVEWVMHTFSKPKDVEEWEQFCDSDIGGKSRARFLYDPSQKAVFEGHLNIEIPKGLPLVRSGYAAVMSPNRYYDLEDFNAIEFMAKGDGRLWILNLRPDLVGMPHLMWQHPFRAEPTWKRYKMMFSDFTFTVRGYENERNEELAPERIFSVGFLIAERRNGPFRLEVDYIKAINTERSARGKLPTARLYKKSYIQNMDEEDGLFDLEQPDSSCNRTSEPSPPDQTRRR